MKALDGKTLVAGQIRAEDVAALGAQGVRTIVNNRPDGEESGQPKAADIEAAAKAAGIEYRHVPIFGAFSESDVAAMRSALEEAEGTVLAFCRSGTRSTYLWALAQARLGVPADEIVRRAAEAGYDLAPIRAFL